jgi:hypothetical protein
MQRLITESRIEHSQEVDLQVHGAVFWISTGKTPQCSVISNDRLFHLDVLFECKSVRSTRCYKKAELSGR